MDNIWRIIIQQGKKNYPEIQDRFVEELNKTRSNDSPWFHIARSATKIDNTRENYSQHNHVAVNLPLTLCLITSSYTRGTDYSSDSIKTSCTRNKVLLQL